MTQFPKLRSIAVANDGLQCLDDLCSQSRIIEEDIKKQAKTPEIEQNKQPKTPEIEQNDKLKVDKKQVKTPEIEQNDQLKVDNKHQQQEVGVQCLFSDFSYPMYRHT